MIPFLLLLDFVSALSEERYVRDDNETTSSSDNLNAGQIVGVSAAGVLALILIALCVYVVRCEAKEAEANLNHESNIVN